MANRISKSIMIPDSTSIHQIAWDQFEDGRKVLTVEFKNGRIYEYEGVSVQRYTAMSNAESVGQYFAKKIKDQYDFVEVSADEELEVENEDLIPEPVAEDVNLDNEQVAEAIETATVVDVEVPEPVETEEYFSNPEFIEGLNHDVVLEYISEDEGVEDLQTEDGLAA